VQFSDVQDTARLCAAFVRRLAGDTSFLR
jgi:hypothetical protein